MKFLALTDRLIEGERTDKQRPGMIKERKTRSYKEASTKLQDHINDGEMGQRVIQWRNTESAKEGQKIRRQYYGKTGIIKQNHLKSVLRIDDGLVEGSRKNRTKITGSKDNIMGRHDVQMEKQWNHSCVLGS